MSDLIRNFVIRWNVVCNSTLKAAWRLQLPGAPSTFERKGSVSIQVLRSAPGSMARRRISMSYRSKGGPDVHFVLHDATAEEQDSAKPRDVLNPLHGLGGEADRQIVSQWNQRSIEGTIKPQWVPLTHAVTLAGSPGRESFIELTRRDNGPVE